MRYQFLRLDIEFFDGATESVEFTRKGDGHSPPYIEGGALHLFTKDGEMAPILHLGSWPLIGIKKYKVVER